MSTINSVTNLPACVNYAIYAGDDFEQTITITDNGSPVDISGDDFEFKVSDVRGEEKLNLTVGSGIEFSGQGVLIITITGIQTAELPTTCALKARLRWIKSGGAKRTIIKGVMEVSPDI